MQPISRRDAIRGVGVGGLVALAGCYGTGSNDDSDTFRLGTNYPISGDLARHGQGARAGIELFVNEINADGGIDGREVELIHKDSPDADAGVSAVEDLATSDNVDAIVGSYSSSISAASTEAAVRYDLVYWETNAFAPSISEPGYDNVFHPNARTTNYGEEGGAIIEEIIVPALETDVSDLDVAVLWEDGEFGAATRDEMEAFGDELGFNIVESMGYPPFEITDFSSEIERLRQAEPDVLYHSGYEADTNLFWNQATDLGLYIPTVIGNGTAYVDTSFREAVPDETMAGIVNVDQTHFNTNPDWAPGMADILKMYKEEYGETPGTQLMATSYSMMEIFAEAAANASSMEPADFQDAVMDIDWEIGTLSNGWGAQFNEEHNRNEAIVVQGTQWQFDEYEGSILKPDQTDGETREVFSIYPEESRLDFIDVKDIPRPDYT